MKKLLATLLIGLVSIVPTFAKDYWNRFGKEGESYVEFTIYPVDDMDGRVVGGLAWVLSLECNVREQDLIVNLYLMHDPSYDVLDLYPTSNLIQYGNELPVKNNIGMDPIQGGFAWEGRYAEMMLRNLNSVPHAIFGFITEDPEDSMFVLMREQGFLKRSHAYNACTRGL